MAVKEPVKCINGSSRKTSVLLTVIGKEVYKMLTPRNQKIKKL